MSLIEIREKSQKFEKTVRWSNLKLLMGIMVVSSIVFFGRSAMMADPVIGRFVGGVAIAAASYVIYQLYRRGSARAVPRDANLRLLSNYIEPNWSAAATLCAASGRGTPVPFSSL